MKFFFQHIEYLLLRHDCVIVPGLGAFIAADVPARIDMERCVVTPPSRSLMFNQAVSLDDGLLANSIARKACISFEEARCAVVRCVARIKEILAHDGFIEIGSLGSLSLGNEGNLIFMPIDANTFSSEKMGYRGLNIAPAGKVDDSEDEGYYEETDKKRYYQLRINKTFARIASMVAVLIAVALTVILNPLPNDGNELRASVVPVDHLLNTQPEEKLMEEAPVAEPAEVAAPQSENIAEPLHYLIVATFSNEKEAERYAERFTSEEFPLTAITSGKMTRVAVAMSDDRGELQKKLNSPSISSRYPNAWIWSR